MRHNQKLYENWHDCFFVNQMLIDLNFDFDGKGIDVVTEPIKGIDVSLSA